MHPVFTRDQTEGESPDVMYAAYRYIDRLFEPKRAATRGAEIAALDLTQMSPRMRYLLRHVLILKRAYEPALDAYPNLRGLESPEVRDMVPEPPLVLTDPPRHTWRYLTERGIWL